MLCLIGFFNCNFDVFFIWNFHFFQRSKFILKWKWFNVWFAIFFLLNLNLEWIKLNPFRIILFKFISILLFEKIKLILIWYGHSIFNQISIILQKSSFFLILIFMIPLPNNRNNFRRQQYKTRSNLLYFCIFFKFLNFNKVIGTSTNFFTFFIVFRNIKHIFLYPFINKINEREVTSQQYFLEETKCEKFGHIIAVVGQQYMH